MNSREESFSRNCTKSCRRLRSQYVPAYQRMQRPSEYELYDLQSDPYEFRNLANDSKHAATLTELKTQLANWRIRTNDPLLNADNLTRLKAEIDACIVGGEAEKGRLNLTYPDYFFTSAPNVTK